MARRRKGKLVSCDSIFFLFFDTLMISYMCRLDAEWMVDH